MTGPGVYPVKAMLGWYELCSSSSGSAAGPVVRFLIEGARKTFQEVAAAI